MAAPIRYGEIQAVNVNGKVKLTCHITPKVKMTVNRFDGNNEIYVHLNYRQKSISLMLNEFEEVCDIYDTLRQKIHLLQQENNQQAPAQAQGFASQTQSFALQAQGFAPPQGFAPQTQVQRSTAQVQGPAPQVQWPAPQVQGSPPQGFAQGCTQGQAHVQAQMQDVWDELF